MTISFSNSNMSKPDLSKIPSFYHGYINQVKEDSLSGAFRMQEPVIKEFLSSVPTDKYAYQYAPGKWSLKEMLQHMIDAERIFAYRALSFARNDSTPLPGFDENEYVKESFANQREWNSLVGELLAVRHSNELFFNSLNDEQLNRTGMANNSTNYVLGWGFIAVGHLAHHIQVMKQRYLTN
jgi:hypothetical protein